MGGQSLVTLFLLSLTSNRDTIQVVALKKRKLSKKFNYTDYFYTDKTRINYIYGN